jgi:hypothetical protein
MFTNFHTHITCFASVLCVLLKNVCRVIHCICVEVSSFALMLIWCFHSMKWVFRNKIPTYNIVLKGNEGLTYDRLLWATVWEQLWSKVQQMPVVIYHLYLSLLNSLIPSGFPVRILYAFCTLSMHVTYSIHALS